MMGFFKRKKVEEERVETKEQIIVSSLINSVTHLITDLNKLEAEFSGLCETDKKQPLKNSEIKRQINEINDNLQHLKKIVQTYFNNNKVFDSNIKNAFAETTFLLNLSNHPVTFKHSLDSKQKEIEGVNKKLKVELQKLQNNSFKAA